MHGAAAAAVFRGAVELGVARLFRTARFVKRPLFVRGRRRGTLW